VEEVLEYGDFSVAVNERKRPFVGSFFDRWADRCAVARGVSVGTLSHPRSLSRVLSGSFDETAPDLAARVGADDPAWPLGMVDITGYGRFGDHAGRCARWGRQGQARLLLDPEATLAHPDPTIAYPLMPPDEAERDAVDAWLDRRAGRLSQQWGASSPELADWTEARRQAAALRQRGASLTRGMAWGHQASAQGDVGLVVDLLDRGVCRAVIASTRQRWDTHADSTAQHQSWNRTFFAIDLLLSGLQDVGLLDQTTVLVVSEMTRTPRRNLHGGKDHWPWTSFLLCGAGIRGGALVGATDDQLRGVAVDLESGEPSASGGALEPEGILAAAAEAVGVDPGWAFPGAIPCRGLLSGG